MKLDRVTLTGADDSVSVDDILKISREFPFVEWGILVHKATNCGHASDWSPRYPSLNWINELQVKTDTNVMLSLHVCGSWIRELLVGQNCIPASLLSGFQRIQLNFHAERTTCLPSVFYMALEPISRDRQIIFQIDGNGGNEHMEALWDWCDHSNGYIDSVALFDVSCGAGVVPEEWPMPKFMLNDQDYDYHGYAGGLGPDNVLDELKRIEQAAGDCRIWIDMETKIRSNFDSQFDLNKCRMVLMQIAPLISR